MKTNNNFLSYLKRHTPLLIILLGIMLRLDHFLENRALWLDEAYVAIDVTARSFRQILLNIPFDVDLPIASPGFLLIEKTSVLLLGNNEYAVRLFPLLCGILSLFLFDKLLRLAAKPEVRVPALSLFVFAEGLIYYSAEAKRYSLDVFLALTLCLIVVSSRSRSLNTARFLLLLFPGSCRNVFFLHSALYPGWGHCCAIRPVY